MRASTAQCHNRHVSPQLREKRPFSSVKHHCRTKSVAIEAVGKVQERAFGTSSGEGREEERDVDKAARLVRRIVVYVSHVIGPPVGQDRSETALDFEAVLVEMVTSGRTKPVWLDYGVWLMTRRKPPNSTTSENPIEQAPPGRMSLIAVGVAGVIVIIVTVGAQATPADERPGGGSERSSGLSLLIRWPCPE